MKPQVNIPKEGDVFLRGDLIGGFHVLNAISLEPIAGPIPSIEGAIEVARRHGGAIWQQTLDNRGRPLGDPFRLLRPHDDAVPPTRDSGESH
jgi:hypothetical protein